MAGPEKKRSPLIALEDWWTVWFGLVIILVATALAIATYSGSLTQLKVPKLGGLWNTLIAAQICATGNVQYRLGAHVGSRLLNAHAMQLAAALPDVWYACEFGEFARLLDDPFEGIEVEDGVIHLPDGPGAGVRPRNDATLTRAAG